jgi:hypothetical protein
VLRASLPQPPARTPQSRGQRCHPRVA